MHLKIGELYKITFLDHCIGQDTAVKCEVIGWLVKNCKESITLTHWRVITTDKELERDNREHTTILKSTIKSKRKM